MDKTVYLLLSLLTLFSFPGESLAQGLQFYGNEKRIAERSSLCVFSEGQAPSAVQRLSVSFTYNAQNVESPGYIFYLKDAESDIAYNLTYDYDIPQQKGNFRFAQDGRQIFHTTTLPARAIHRNRMQVTIRMDFAQNQASIRIGNDSASIADIGWPPRKQQFIPRLFFGMYRHILETASFCLHDLRVECDGRSWAFPLDESRGEAVHDSLGSVTGHVENPIWLINDAYHWKPLYHYRSSSPAGFAFSTSQQLAYIYNRDSLIVYDPYHHQAQGSPYDSPALPVRLGMCFFDEADACIYAYELNGLDTYMARIDPATRRWEIIDQGKADLQMHHHGALFSQHEKRFLFFGGYGNRSYYNTFVRYDLATNRWDTVAFDGPSVPPRFFVGMAMAPDGRHAYLYGGKGNEAGDQNVGIRYYYDLYRLDFDRHRIEKLWEDRHITIDEDKVPAREMVPTPDGKWLYLLAYPEYKPKTHLRLYRLSVADGCCEAVGDSIPMTSEEIATNANLYYSARLNEFYCVIQEFGKYGDNDTRIYALAAPPVNETAVHRYDHPQETSTPAGLWIGAVLLVLGTGAAVGFAVVRKQQEKQRAQAKPAPAAEEMPAIPSRQAGPTANDIQEEEGETDNATPALPIENRIHLFGPFCAIDRRGRDMSHLFSPKIRHLFLYILINSVLKDGVLSADLNVLFWPDKPEDKIKNLKNVHINHLRKALQYIDGIELLHNQGYYRLQLSDELFCDFRRFAMLTANLTRTPERTEERDELVNLLSRGRFLGTVRNELFDYSKQQVESFAIPFLEQQFKTTPPAAVIRLCKILQTWDPLSETALRQAVRSYRRSHQPDKALQAYKTFAAEWRHLMGEEYPTPFEDLDDGEAAAAPEA